MTEVQPEKLRLTDVEHVRTRPGMYVGGLNARGLHHLVWELVDNAVEEAVAGSATAVHVRVAGDGSCAVADDGRGVPVATHPETGVPIVEVIFTTLGGYTGPVEPLSTKVNGGYPGTGAAIVNFMSAALDVEVCRDGAIHRMRFERGVKVDDLYVAGPTDRTGTRVRFTPDPTLFKGLTFDHGTLRDRLRELAFLNAGVETVLEDERVGTRDAFRFDDGLAGYVRVLAGARRPLTDVVRCTRRDPATRFTVNVALQYAAAPGRTLLSYVNNAGTRGGTHVSGFEAGLGTAFSHYSARARSTRLARQHGFGKGLIAIVSVTLPEPIYAGSTRDKLLNPEVRGFVSAAVADGFGQYLFAHTSQAEALLV